MFDTNFSCFRTVTYGRTDAVQPQASKKGIFVLIFWKFQIYPLDFMPQNKVIFKLKSVELLAQSCYTSLLTDSFRPAVTHFRFSG
jgi:hypothetical protein